MTDFIQGVNGDPTVYVNGAFVPLSEASISVLDRGFIFGDGIYEVVPIYHGQPFRMTEHLSRLDRSLAKLEIAPPMDRQAWLDLVTGLVALDTTQDCAMVYIQVTRGVAKRDHAFPNPPVKPTVFAMLAPMTHRLKHYVSKACGRSALKTSVGCIATSNRFPYSGTFWPSKLPSTPVLMKSFSFETTT